ncbi:MAG TPA: DinB family protein [Ohtaekwangia sp.]|nr:DinB family protein [Ohtaekwangia sp.]
MNALDLVTYNTWANRLVCSQVETLPQDIFEKNFGGSFGSVKATLIHVLESDWLWLNRWRGIPLQVVPDWPVDTAKAITAIWQPIQDEMIQHCSGVSGKPETPLEFITRKGVPHTMRFADVVTHISHHGSYHRGQLANMIRQSGLRPVSTDYFIFCTITKPA